LVVKKIVKESLIFAFDVVVNKCEWFSSVYFAFAAPHTTPSYLMPKKKSSKSCTRIGNIQMASPSIGRLVVVMGQDFVSALQSGGFLYYPRMKANVTE
jgi:hypothetical protein